MKLLLSIIVTSLACGVFAGLCFSDGWAWAFAVGWSVWTGVLYLRAEIEKWNVNEVEL